MEDTTVQLPDFLIIPSQIILDKNLTPLDGQVYGLVYWYTKLRLQKCIASSEHLGKMLHTSEGSVQNSINRLIRYNYLQSIYDRQNHRRELIPLISFGSTTSNNVVAPHQIMSSTTSNNVFDIYNKNNKEEKIKKKREDNNYNNETSVNEVTPGSSRKTVIYQKSPPSLCNKPEYLEQIPLEDLEHLQKNYQVSISQIKEKARHLQFYIKKHGKTYRDYKAMLEEALYTDYGERKLRVTRPSLEDIMKGNVNASTI